jgi:hypothetical protein
LPESASEPECPEDTEETLVGGIVSLIVREISAGRTAELEQLLPDLTELLQTPVVPGVLETRPFP